MITEESTGNTTYIFEGDTVTIGIMNQSGSSPVAGYDYGFYAQVYPIYTTEQTDTEASDEFDAFTAVTGTYVTTTNWYGSWYGDINGKHYDFLSEAEVTKFLAEKTSTLSGTTIDLYRGLTFTEAYTRANKSRDGGYYKQQELTKSMCNIIAITQNQTLKDVRDNNTYMVGKLKDGNCWMLDNLALDPTDPTTAANMNESNTNATAAAIYNLLNGGSAITGWSSVTVADVDTNFNSRTAPMINNASKDVLITSYGPASVNGQAKVGIYYNYCAASAGTYCYGGQGVDIPDTLIDVSQDLCPASWRMPTGGDNGEYAFLYNKYKAPTAATNTASLQYNFSTPLSGYFWDHSAYDQGGGGNFWSSTSQLSDMYFLSIEPDYTFVNSVGGSRFNGYSMRCLVDKDPEPYP